MPHLSKRDFLMQVGAVSAITFYSALGHTKTRTPSAPARPVRIDTLCYPTDDLSQKTLENVWQGGLTAVVWDIQKYPRTFDSALSGLGQLNTLTDAADARGMIIRTASDFIKAYQAQKLGIVIASQDAAILGTAFEDYKEHLRLFYKLGLRMLQLTHNGRTPWADTYFSPRDGGLTREGNDLVRLMNQTGMIVDLSHCSRFTLLDTVSVSQKPCIVSHAGCYALAPTARNKTDEEIKAIGKSGGMFCVFGLTNWLTQAPSASIDTVIDHIDHAVQLIGPQHVGFGSDGGLERRDAEEERIGMEKWRQRDVSAPSSEWPFVHVRVPELNAPTRMTALAEGLARRGYSETDVANITGRNFTRLFEAVCG